MLLSLFFVHTLVIWCSRVDLSSSMFSSTRRNQTSSSTTRFSFRPSHTLEFSHSQMRHKCFAYLSWSLSISIETSRHQTCGASPATWHAGSLEFFLQRYSNFLTLSLTRCSSSSFSLRISRTPLMRLVIQASLHRQKLHRESPHREGCCTMTWVRRFVW